MEKGILLNDEGLKVNCIIEDNNITFEFDKGLDFLSELLRIEKNDNLTFVYLGLKKILRIENNHIERILPVREIDVKILKALYENNNKMNSRNMIECFLNVKNNITSYSYNSRTTTRTLGLIPKVKTETHAYLTEILDAKELIRFLNEYDVKYPMNEYAELDFNSDKYYRYDEIEYYNWESNLERALKVNLAHDVTLEQVDEVIKNREKLLKLACLSLEEMLGESVEWKKIETDIKEASDDILGQIKSLDEYIQDKDKEEKKKYNKEKIRLNEKLNKLNKLKSSQAAKILYNELLNISLDKLTNSKVDYSTITFSNDARLEFMSMKHEGDKRFNFLYSIEKEKSIKKFEDYAKSLENLLKTNMVIGSEICGFENGVEDSEYDSLKEKLEIVLPVLHMHPKSVLRIYASGFRESTSSIERTLEALNEVSIKINESCVDLFGSEWGILPPPVLRLSHGLNLEDNQNLIRLIREFNAVVEYNLSSNKTLRKVKDYSKLSLGYYDKNKIKYVFSNDLGGLYYYDDKEANIVRVKVETKKDTASVLEEKSDEIKPVEEEIIPQVVHPIEALETEESEVYEPLEEESELEKSLYDIFSDLKKDNKEYNSYEEALEEENKLFTYDDKVLSETEKVNDEIFRIKKYIMENNFDLDNDYIEKKINIVNSYNDNSQNSDFAKMYLFLLEREMFPELSTSFKSIEYLYKNKDKEKNNIEKELDRIFALVTEQYDTDTSDNSLI